MSKTIEALEAARKQLESPPSNPELREAFKQGALDLINAALEEHNLVPVAKQFKHPKSGHWGDFVNEEDYKATIAAGIYEIRNLYTEMQLKFAKNSSLEKSAQMAENIRPLGGRAFTEGQEAYFEALTYLAKEIRKLKVK